MAGSGASWRAAGLEQRNVVQRHVARVTAELVIKGEVMTDPWPAGIAKQLTQIIIVELNAAYPRRLAIGHAWNGGADGRRDTAGAAACTAPIVLAGGNQRRVIAAHVGIRSP